MESRLDESRAIIIRNAIRNDGFDFGIEAFCDSHHLTQDEVYTFLDYAVDHAKMVDFKSDNAEVGSIEVEMTFIKHAGKVGTTNETWSVEVPQHFTTQILSVAEHGPVSATLVPEQIALPLGMSAVDDLTGEVF